MRVKCYECAYKGDNPGSCHIRCTFDWKKSKKPMPKGSEHGRKKGWYFFPLNFDPNWMEEECPSFSKEKDPNLTKEKYDPLTEIFSILRSVGR